MKRKVERRIAAAVTAALCVSMLAGCGSSKIDDTMDSYFSGLSEIVETSVSYAKADKTVSSSSQAVAENAIAAPANFTVDENGNYSFDAVEHAQYYVVYLYNSVTSMTASATSEKIMDDGSASYSGALSDLMEVGIGNWDVRVIAYPDYDNTDYAASPYSNASYTLMGEAEIGDISFEYMWNVESKTLEIQLNDMGMNTAPETVEVVLTNTADSSDVVTVSTDDVSSSSMTVLAEGCKEDASYSITANFTWDETIVTNPSATVEGDIVAKTSSTDNLISEKFYYLGSLFYGADFPHVQMNFDPAAGGQAGMWYNDGSVKLSNKETDAEGVDINVYFTAYPIEAQSGAKYSYDIEVTSPRGYVIMSSSTGRSSTETVYGLMNIYADHTFSVELEYQYIRTDGMNSQVYYVPGAICYGTYTENADGTLNLSYDHENAKETDYEIYTELTGKAAEAAAAKAASEAENPQSASQPSQPQQGQQGAQSQAQTTQKPANGN